MVIGDIHMPGAEDVAARILVQGGVASVIRYDGGDMDSVEALVVEAQRRHGRIDGLHNIAGNPSAQRDDLDLISSVEAVWLPQFRSHFIVYAHAAKIDISGGRVIGA